MQLNQRVELFNRDKAHVTQQQPTFSDFSNSSDSKVKVKVKVKGPNMCYIFEKHEIQGYRI